VRRLLLLLFSLPAACNSAPPYATTVGILKPGATMVVHVADARFNAYQPASGQRRDLFTVAATALPKSTPAAPRLRVAPRGVIVDARAPLASLLVRVPDEVNLIVESRHGDVNVTDISGNARVVALAGNVDLMLPGYAQVAVGVGNLSVTMGATSWPGTLHFSTQRGDVVLRVIGKAAFEVHLHTDDGTLFTDFALRGGSQGRSETIDGAVNGGGGQRIDVRTHAGAIRLLRLQPQP
jgi:hypothetical protein